MGVIPADLLKQYLRIDKRYSINPVEEPFFDVPASLDLDKMEYTPPTSEEIEAQARENLAASYSEKKLKEELSYQKAVNDAEIKKQQIAAVLEADKQKTDADFEAEKAALKLKLINSGLSRSSVFDNAVLSIDASCQEQKQLLEQQAQSEINAVDAEVLKAEEEKNSAIANIEQVFLLDLEAEKAKLTDDVAKKQEEVLKYNNTVDEKQATYKRTWNSAYIAAQKQHTESATALQDVAVNQGYEIIQNYIFDDKTLFTKDYFLNFTPQEAVNALAAARTDFENQLGVTNYNELVGFFQERT